MSYQFKKVPDAKSLGVSKKVLDKITNFDNNFTGHEHPKRIVSGGKGASTYVNEMISLAEGVKHGMDNNLTLNKAMQELHNSGWNDK